VIPVGARGFCPQVGAMHQRLGRLRSGATRLDVSPAAFLRKVAEILDESGVPYMLTGVTAPTRESRRAASRPCSLT
jgi:hypothetical protein